VYAFDDVFKLLDANGDGMVSFDEATKFLEWPDPVQRWAASLPLAELLADAMPVVNREDALEEISRLDDTLISAICEGLQLGLQRLIIENVKLLREGLEAQRSKAQGQEQDAGASTKFRVIKMNAGSVEDFHKGLEDRVGRC